MADLSDLRQLKLNSTLLTGPIPAGLGNLPNLEFLELVFNERLIGSIPSRLRDLRLAKLDLMGTPVCVPADAEFQTWLGAIDDFPLPGADVRGTRARGVDRGLGGLLHAGRVVAALERRTAFEVPKPRYRARRGRRGWADAVRRWPSG